MNGGGLQCVMGDFWAGNWGYHGGDFIALAKPVNGLWKLVCHGLGDRRRGED